MTAYLQKLAQPFGRIVLSACVFVGASELRAQSAPDTVPVREGDVLPLDEIVVSVTRRDNAVRDLPAHVSVLTKPVIEASAAQNLPDLLRKIPGFTLRDYQGGIATHPSRQAPALRGLGGGTSAGRTLILVDGLPVNDPWAGWVHWARIPLDLVDRVEVVRSGGSGIWGSRAMGGVINIITRAPQETGASLGLQAGNYSTLRSDGTASYKGERLGVSLTGEYLDSDGYKVVRADQRTEIDTPAGTRHGVLFAKAEYEASETVDLHLHASFLDESRRFGTPLRGTGMKMWSIRGGTNLTTSESSEISALAFASGQSFNATFSSEALDRSSEVPSLDQFDVPAVSAGGNVQFSSRAFRDHELTTGLDLMWVDGEVNEDFFYSSNEFLRRRRVAGQQLLSGLYVQDLMTLGSSWKLLASARLDNARQSRGLRTETNLATDEVLRDTAFASLNETTLNFSLGVRRPVGGGFELRGQVFRGYRSPTLNELYKPFREPGNVVTEANPDLRAERTFGAEVGVDYAVTRSAFLALTGFWTHVDNPIIEATVEEVGPTARPIAPCGFVPAGGVCRQRRNLEGFRSLGLEATARLLLADYWLLQGSYIWNPTEVVSAPDNPELEGNSGSRTAEHSFTAGIQYADPSTVDASVLGRFVGRRYEDDLNSLLIDPFFVVDVRVARSLHRNLEGYASVENLFDVEYEAALSTSGLVRIGAPRTVVAGVRMRFSSL